MREADDLITFTCRMSWKSGSLNHLGHTGPVTGLLYLYVKIYITTAATCFGAFTASSGSALLVLAKVTVVKIAN